jgi:hypothetical protein
MGFSNGDNLSIIIACEHLLHHNWMSFASWYSISKKLPDAHVTIGLIRGCPKVELFSWPGRYGVQLIQHQKKVSPLDLLDSSRKKICISPSVMALRDYNENFLGPVEAKSQELTTFVDYFTGCGSFVMSEWINKLMSPFDGAVRAFAASDMTANEIAVLKVWDRIASLHAV